jgi:predicted DsbA family dithiol-disulfide isomerase
MDLRVVNVHKIRIDLVSDVVCPWCIVGYKRLEIALETLKDQVEAEIHWHPFELNPTMPQEGQHLREHIMEKYGSSAADSDRARESLKQVGDALGFEFNFSEDMRIYNTRKAHQLLQWSESFGKKTELKLALFDAYFTRNQALNEADVLLEAVSSIGLDVTDAAAVMGSQDWHDKVVENERHWQQAGVQAVPSFIINQAYLISGAQDPESLAQALLDIAKQS